MCAVVSLAPVWNPTWSLEVVSFKAWVEGIAQNSESRRHDYVIFPIQLLAGMDPW